MKTLLTIVFAFIVLLARGQSDKDMQGSSLIKAAEEGNEEVLIMLLKQKPDIDFRDDQGGTALFYATQNHHLNIVKILIYNGANPNLSLYDGFSPLMSAAYTGDFDIAEYLAFSGAHLDDYDQYKATALHYAVGQRDFLIADMLLFYGADVNVLTVRKTSPLLVAALMQDTAIARILIQKGADVDAANKWGYNPLSVAIQNNDTAMFDLLLAAGAKPEKMPAVQPVKANMMQSMKAEVSTRKQGYKAYSWALLNGNTYAFRKLKPAQPGLEGMQNRRTNPLILAYFNNDKSLVKELKSEGYQAGFMPYIAAIMVDVNFVFNTDDFFFTLGSSVKDVKYKLIAGGRYGTRFKEKAIFEEQDYGLLQLWEHRRYFEFNLQKYFVVSYDQISLEPFVQLGVQWMWGSYNGLSRKLDNSFVWVPKAGMRVFMENVYFSMAYEYTPYGLYDVSPHKMSLGVGYQINRIRKPAQYQIPWL